MALHRVKVVKVIEEACGIRSFLLAKTGLFKLPAYTPGAHIDVHCGDGIIRQYSLCGDPTDRHHYLIAVKQVSPSRGGSDLMHQVVEQGDCLEIGSPRNSFELNEAAAHTILLAAGIGLTPIIAMADRLHAIGRSFELHVFSRGEQHTAFKERLITGDYAASVRFLEGLDIDPTRTAVQEILSNYVSDGQVYLCGPAPFMDMAEQFASEQWPQNSVHLERFAANPALTGAPTHAFTIVLARSGQTLHVNADETILEVLDANGIDAAFSCEQGVCGTCVTDVLEGDPDHRDTFLSAKQTILGKKMCLCVSRAKGETITLDI